MEKIKTLKLNEKLLEVLSSKKAKYVVGTVLLSGIGVLLPRLFHAVAGSTAGATFLPMHIAVLIAALTFGITSSSIVAGSTIILSYLFSGMPALARLPYMLIELVIYALLLSILNRKFNSIVSLTITIILGRVVYAITLFVAINVLGFETYGISVIESIRIGMPGIIIQLLCTPVIANVLNKGLKLKND